MVAAAVVIAVSSTCRNSSPYFSSKDVVKAIRKAAMSVSASIVNLTLVIGFAVVLVGMVAAVGLAVVVVLPLVTGAAVIAAVVAPHWQHCLVIGGMTKRATSFSRALWRRTVMKPAARKPTPLALVLTIQVAVCAVYASMAPYQ